MNSYLPFETIDSKLKVMDRSHLWETLLKEEKDNLIDLAMITLNSFSYVGNKISNFQPNQFPRTFDYFEHLKEYDGIIPEEVKMALLHQILFYINKPDTEKLDGISQFSSPMQSVTFKNGYNPLYSNMVHNHIKKFIKRTAYVMI